MPSAIDICNMALGEIGSRTLVNSLGEDTPAGVQCTLFYNTLRQQLLRAAPWGFARKTLALTSLGLATDDPNPVPFPWQAMYLYPPDCLGMRYILPPPFPTQVADVPDVSTTLLVPWCPPSRTWRYLKSYDDASTPARTVILSNVVQALGVYTADVEDPGLFDPLFVNALAMMLASKLVMPLTGNAGMKGDYFKLAFNAVQEARARDGNESITSSDVVVDWITTREVGNYTNLWTYNGPAVGLGSWLWQYDSNWSM